MWWVLLLALLVWLWYLAVGVRDAARRTCEASCRRVGVQLIDQTISLKGLSLDRASGKSRSVTWHYRFEFSETGWDRRPGQMTMRGSVPHWIEFSRSHGPEMLTFN